MTKYESSVKQIYYPQGAVYGKLSDLTNLESLRDAFSNPAFVDNLRASGQVPEDKMEQMRTTLESMTFTTDAVTVGGTPLGNVTLQIVERAEPKCIKFEVVGAPIAGNLWIQLLPTSETECKMKCTIGADLNFFMKQMAKKPLQEGVEKLAEMLARIPY